jgi:hypothetical protein
MNRTKTLWKTTVTDYVRGSDGVERRKRREITLGRVAAMTKREAQRKLQPYVDRVDAAAFNPTREEKKHSLLGLHYRLGA